MLHECLVIDNSNFFKNGTIRVRIKDHVVSDKSMVDLSINPAESINKFPNQRYEIKNGEKKFRYDDEDVYVSSSMGVAFDYGLFYLPQPNTYGLVSDISFINYDDNKIKYVWVGGIFKMNEMSKDIYLPSNNEEVKNGCNKGTTTIDNLSDIIFKQKETHISDSSEKIYSDKSKKTLDWNQRKTNNMIVLGKDNITILHNDFNEKGEPLGQSKIILNSDGSQIHYNDNDNKYETNFKLHKGLFELTNKNEKKENSSIRSDENGISINYNSEDNININVGKGLFGNSCASISASSKYNKSPTEIILDSSDGITINSDSNITINPGQGGTVSLGTGEGYVLTTLDSGTFNIDNHTITAVKDVRA